MLNLLHEPPLSSGTIVVKPRSLTVEQYHREMEEGKITKKDKVELIRCQLVKKEPMTPLHAATIRSLGRCLRAISPTGWFTQEEKPITLADSEPEPDLSVVRERSDDYFEFHPRASDLAFVVEVSMSSLADDREIKRLLYAEAGIPYYWIVNLIDTQIEVYSEPALGDYRSVFHYAKTDAVPIVVEGREIGRIALADFTPQASS